MTFLVWKGWKSISKFRILNYPPPSSLIILIIPRLYFEIFIPSEEIEGWASISNPSDIHPSQIWVLTRVGLAWRSRSNGHGPVRPYPKEGFCAPFFPWIASQWFFLGFWQIWNCAHVENFTPVQPWSWLIQPYGFHARVCGTVITHTWSYISYRTWKGKVFDASSSRPHKY